MSGAGGPFGGRGRTSLSRALLAEDAALALSVSVTTARPADGRDRRPALLFLSIRRSSTRWWTRARCWKHAHVFGRSYGTPRVPVEARLAESQDVLFDIDWQGYRQLRAALPMDVVGVFIRPPSLEALEMRLQGRGDSQEQIERRMSHAEEEMSHAHEFDYLVENVEFATALEDLRAILRASRLASFRRD